MLTTESTATQNEQVVAMGKLWLELVLWPSVQVLSLRQHCVFSGLVEAERS